MSTEGVHRKLAAILCADVEGYSRLMEDDPEGTLHTLTDHREVFRRCTEHHEGRVVDSPGDNILIEFASAIEAVQCAVEIQRELAEKNAELADDRRMRFRIGIDLGDLLEQDDALYGDGVNISARLQSLAESGGICVSGRAYDQVVNRLQLKFEFLGKRSVKNIAHPIRVYRVLTKPEAVSTAIKEKKTSKMVSRRLATTTIIALIIIAAGSLVWNISSHQPIKIEQASEPEQAPAILDVAEASKTIAVLPFEDLSPEKDQEYFVDGLIEELLNSLAKIPDLLVTARTSSFIFKESDKTAQEIAGILGVANILEGSVRKAGEKLRITAQLIRATDGFHLWSNTYDGELKDIFEVQEEIATAVANELKVKLGVGESLKQLGGTDNPEAYELYLVAKGILLPSGVPKPELSKIEYAKRLESSELIDSAIALDNEFALAWVLKADALFMIGDVDESLKAVQKAIELEPNLTEGYIELAKIRSIQGEYAKAELAFKKAAEVTSKPLGAIPEYLERLIMKCYFERARVAAEEALRIDPLNEEILSLAIDIYGRLGDLQRAEKAYERAKAIIGYDPDNERRINQARLLSGNVISSDDIVDPNPIMVALKEYVGSPQEGLAELHRFYNDDDYQDMPSLMSIWMWAAYFGDTELAMEILEKIYSVRHGLVDIVWTPAMKPIRQLPRFKELVQEVGYVDLWNEFGWPDICHPLDNGDFVCD